MVNRAKAWSQSREKGGVDKGVLYDDEGKEDGEENVEQDSTG